jgi:hypothetical protein
MTLDDVKNFLASSNGPWAVLLALALIFGIPSYPNRWLAAFAPGWLGGLAGAIGADDAGDRAGARVETQIPDRVHAAETQSEIAHRYSAFGRLTR